MWLVMLKNQVKNNNKFYHWTLHKLIPIIKNSTFMEFQTIKTRFICKCSPFYLGAVHKRCHQSRGGGFVKRWSYLISLSSESDEKGGGGQKSQKIDDGVLWVALNDGKYFFKMLVLFFLRGFLTM